MGCINLFAQDENSKYSVEEDTELSRTEEIDGNGGIILLSKLDNLIVRVTSGNQVGEMLRGNLRSDGYYEYKVITSLQNGHEARFIFTRKGDTERMEIKEKRLKPNFLYGYRMKQVDNPIKLRPQPLVGGMHPSATEAMVEISTPFDHLDIEVPDALPYSVKEGKQENDNSITVYRITVPVKAIRTLSDDLESLKAKYEQLSNELMNAEDSSEDPRWDECDRMDLEVEEMKAKLDMSQLILLKAPGSNALSIDVSSLAPRSLFVVAVVPIVEKEIVVEYSNVYERCMGQAQDAYENQKYGTAQKLYQEAAEQEGITDRQKNIAIESATSMNHLAELADGLKRRAAYWKTISNDPTVKRSQAEECIKEAMEFAKKLYEQTHNEKYNSLCQRYKDRYDNFPIVIEGSIKLKDYDKGVMKVISLNNCDIYASGSDKYRGERVGAVNSDGTFHIQLERGRYRWLTLVPLKDCKLKKERKILLKDYGCSSMYHNAEIPI